MGLWLLQHKDAIDTLSKIVASGGTIVASVGVIVTALLAFGGGLGALYQYAKSTSLRATDTLLKVEEEFRTVLPTFAKIEDLPTYRRVIVPVLQSEEKGTLDDAGLAKLTELDRALRFLYFCSVLNDSLGADRAFGVAGGALQRAYYHYFRFLLPEERHKRPELLTYTDKEYKRLTRWIKASADDLRRITDPPTS